MVNELTTAATKFGNMILHECSCFIEFIKRVEKKRSNARLAEHFICFLQRV